ASIRATGLRIAHALAQAGGVSPAGEGLGTTRGRAGAGGLTHLWRQVGGRLAHVTARCNVASIRATGLRSAHALAQDGGVSPADLCLRKTRVTAGSALLNHQKPIVHGLRAARRVLDGHTPDTWAAQLDRRIFLWPRARAARFAASFRRSVDTEILWIDPVRLGAAMWDHLDLCPLNSGSFEQGASKAVRGDWIYVPLSRGLDAFRDNRRLRGHATRRDSVGEVSLRAPLPASILNEVLSDD
ncbi:MAG: hypothetical protein AAF727_09015, partial [Pseudomonadota bacterium]